MLATGFVWFRGWVSRLLPVVTVVTCGGTVGSQNPEVSEEGSGSVVRIMPLGDSITEGIDARSSYRYWLGRGLRQEGVAFDFVGSLRGARRGRWPKGVDGDHEGHWGWRADQVAERLDGWLAAAKPDVVLLHLGHNDLSSEAPARVAREVAELTARIRSSASEPEVLVARVIPEASWAGLIERFNEVLATELGAADDPGVYLVDLATGFDPRRQTADGLHPNEDGARWMAERWLRALLDVLGSM